MSGLFSKAWRGVTGAVIDPQGRRLLGLTMESKEPIWAPKGHSLLLSANGGGKTTRALMPWLFSLLASTSRPAILVFDSKDGEIAAQCAPMLVDMGVPIALIDDMGVLDPTLQGRTALNPFGAATHTYASQPQDMIFANESLTHTLIEEPENDQRNYYWRAWPRSLIEFAILIVLKRSPALATPGGVWALLASPEKMQRFAEIEAVEGTGQLKALAENILGMVGHEHWPQHLQAAQDTVRIFAQGSRLHLAGHEAKVTHADLINQRAVIFLCGSQAHMGSLGSYYGLHLMGFINAAYGRAGPLWIVADEFTNAPVKKLVEALTTLRAYGVTISMIAQSRSEIERKLGKNETLTIEENAITKQWYGFSSFEEAERVSKSIGEEHAVATGLGGSSDDLKIQTNLSLIKQRHISPAELMAMPADEQLIHIKGIGFARAKTLSQQNIAPFCNLLADNPLEGGRLTPDPKITFTLPEEARS